MVRLFPLFCGVLVACGTAGTQAPADPATPVAEGAPPAKRPALETRISSFDPTAVPEISSGASCQADKADGTTAVFDDFTNLFVGIDGAARKMTLVSKDDDSRKLTWQNFEIELKGLSGSATTLVIKDGGGEGTLKLGAWSCGS